MLLTLKLLWLDAAEVCGRLVTESGDNLATEAGDLLVTECFVDPCGRLITESGLGILTEAGDRIVAECFPIPPIPVVTLRPGKVWKKKYPYWSPHSPSNRPLSEDEEEALILMGMDLE